ncbi:MAG: hypothetical protein IID45_10975 [Planctomycetes bacterium]|nr:hypothetical protein [Planctomycetota bacterium]
MKLQYAMCLMWVLAGTADAAAAEKTVRCSKAKAVNPPFDPFKSSVKEITVKRTDAEKKAMAAIRKLGGRIDVDWRKPKFPIIGVDFSSKEVTDAALVHLKVFKHLRHLFLFGTKITDVGLLHLRGLQHLESLGLYRAPITDAGLKHLKSLKQLKSLHLLGTKVTGNGFVHLEKLTELQMLDLQDTPISDAQLVQLRRLAHIQSLWISSEKITDTGLSHLKGLVKLHSLSLTCPKITDAGLLHLEGMAKLRMLQLVNTKITDAGLKKLKVALPKCNVLVVRLPVPAKPIDDAKDRTPEKRAIAAIERFGGRVKFTEKKSGKPIVSVDLIGSTITDAGLVQLKNLTNVQ